MALATLEESEPVKPEILSLRSCRSFIEEREKQIFGTTQNIPYSIYEHITNIFWGTPKIVQSAQ